MRINVKIIQDFRKLLESLEEFTKMYNVNVKNMCEAIQMSEPTYYSKRKSLKFTIEEIENIVNYINDGKIVKLKKNSTVLKPGAASAETKTVLKK